MFKFRNPPKYRSPAQAMVEFALALPILLLVVYGLLEAGRLLFTYASVVTAARQAARYGSATGLTPANVSYYKDCTGIRAAAKRVAFINRINDADINITYDHGLDGSGNPRPFKGNFPACWNNNTVISNGDRIRVQVSSQWSPIVRIIPSWTGFMITSQSNRTLLVGASIAIDATQQGYYGSGQLILSKSPSPETYDTVGQVITYTYTLVNPGTDPIAGPVTIVDDKLGNVNCSVATIPGGNGSASCTATYTITQADINNLSVTNKATATAENGGQPLSASASATITAVPRPALALTKAGVAPKTIERGAIIVYTYTIKNTGNIPVTSPFSIEDNKIRAQNIDCGGATSPLQPGATTACTGRYSITNQDLDAAQVVNIATASAMYKTQKITSAEATATVYISPFVLTLTASPASVSAAGQVITFTYTLHNAGTTPLTSPTIRSNTLAGITMNCGGLPDLAPGASASCTGTYKVSQANINSGSIINSARASATSASGATMNSNLSTAMVPVTQIIQLQLTKTASVQTAYVLHTTIDYTYTLQNTGNVDLSGPYKVTDDKDLSVNCAGATSPLAPGATTTCTASYATVQADIDEGSIVNHATATANFFTQTVTSNQASAKVITYEGPRLRLNKVASPPTMSRVAGQVITYTYILKNTGGIDLTAPYSVTDDKIASVDCSGAAATLAPADSTTCTGTYTTTVEDVGTGSVTNNATATAGSAQGPIPSNQATATVPVYACSATTLTFGPIPSSSDVTWTINNNSGTQVRVSSVTIQWSNPSTVALSEVDLGGNAIWTGTDTSGNFTVPGQSWTINAGLTDLRVLFSGPATEIRGTVTLTDVSCPN